jgi:hypothetical protein
LRAETRTKTHFNDAFNPARRRPSGLLSLTGQDFATASLARSKPAAARLKFSEESDRWR